MIAVTGAAGKTGQAILAQLVRHEVRVRVLVRRPEQAAVLTAAGAAEAVLGDMTDAAVLARLLDGANVVYHICPNLHPAEAEVTQAMVTACRAAGAVRLVYHSVLHPQTEAMPHHWAKLRSEELIFQSGVPFTILQPAAYMQNLRAYWPAMVADGVYRVPYAVTTRIGMVDLHDVAQAAALVLLDSRHSYGIYELATGERHSQVEVAALAAQALGRPVRAEAVDRAHWAAAARRNGLGDGAVDILLRMFEYYERYGFGGNGFVLAALLGRPPATLQTFLAQLAAGG